MLLFSQKYLYLYYYLTNITMHCWNVTYIYICKSRCLTNKQLLCLYVESILHNNDSCSVAVVQVMFYICVGSHIRHIHKKYNQSRHAYCSLCQNFWVCLPKHILCSLIFSIFSFSVQLVCGLLYSDLRWVLTLLDKWLKLQVVTEVIYQQWKLMEQSSNSQQTYPRHMIDCCNDADHL